MILWKFIAVKAEHGAHLIHAGLLDSSTTDSVGRRDLVT